MQNLNRKEETNENDQSGNYFNDSYKNNKNRINNIISINHYRYNTDHINPSPMFKYIKSPLSIETQAFIENIFSSKRLIKSTGSPRKKLIKTRNIKQIVFKPNNSIELASLLTEETKSKHSKCNSIEIGISNKSSSRALPKLIHFKSPSMSLKYNQMKMMKIPRKINYSADLHRKNIQTEPNKKVKNSTNDTISNSSSQVIQTVKKTSSINIIPKHLLPHISNKNLIIVPSNQKKRNTISLTNIMVQPFTTKTKIESHPNSLIEESITKTYITSTFISSTKCVHFSMSKILNVPSFSIYGIAHGEGPRGYFSASVARDSFLSYFSTLITYDIAYHPTSEEVLKSLTENNFEVIKSTFVRVYQDISAALNDEPFDCSSGLVFIIGNDVIFAGKGKKVYAINITKQNKDTAEYVKSNKIFGGDSSSLDEYTIVHMKHNKEMKYIVMFNENFMTTKMEWRNIVKIVTNENKMCEVKSEIEGEKAKNVQKNIFLQEKLERIHEYSRKMKMYEKGINEETVNSYLNYSIIIMKFI